jgi:hypothetical protein
LSSFAIFELRDRRNYQLNSLNAQSLDCFCLSPSRSRIQIKRHLIDLHTISSFHLYRIVSDIIMHNSCVAQSIIILFNRQLHRSNIEERPRTKPVEFGITSHYDSINSNKHGRRDQFRLPQTNTQFINQSPGTTLACYCCFFSAFIL